MKLELSDREAHEVIMALEVRASRLREQAHYASNELNSERAEEYRAKAAILNGVRERMDR